MTNEKFTNEALTLKRFFQTYCCDKHTDRSKTTHDLNYKDFNLTLETELCDDCNKLITYSFNQLQKCPHDEKPRCRKCPNPCYDKREWKHLAKLMRYSGFKLGLLKIKNFFKK